MMAFLHFLTWVWCKFWKAWPTGMKVDRGKNIRLVVLSWRFIVSDTSGRLVVYRVRLVYSLFYEVGSSFRELVSSSCQFDSSAGLLRVWPITDHIGFSLFVVLPFRCFVRASSLHVFWRFGSSSQRGYNLTCLTWNVTWFHALIRDPSLHNWVSAKLQHRIRLESSGW